MSDRHRRLMSLFDELCDADAAAQAARIDALRGEDAELARELEGMLGADRSPAFDTARLVDRTQEAGDEAIPPLPERVGRYRILRELGSGGMSVVYEAEQEEPRRTVALKIVRWHAGDEATRARFAVEAQALARLRHPGIAHVYEAGTLDELAYIAMERIEGDTLIAHAARAGLDARRRLELMAQIAEAVHHAHLRGVLHRDLKPANIVVDSDGQPKVLDFGVARLLEADAPATPELVGTPAYMSPEQAGLAEEGLDARSDVYSLGLVAFELLAGRLPYDFDGQGLPAVLRAIHERPPLPLGAVRPELRGDVELIVARALAREPAGRYPSAEALAGDLRRFLRHQPISARPPSALYTLGKLARRNPPLAAATGALALALVAGLAIVSSLYVKVRAARRATEERNGQLILAQARGLLELDPTDAVAWLKRLPAGGPWTESSMLAGEAEGLGVARDLLVGHDGQIRWLAWSPDGRLLATASQDRTVRVWDLAARSVRVLEGHGDEAKLVAFAEGGATLVSGGEGGELHVWRPGGGGTALPSHGGEVTGLELSPDGRWLATAGLDGEVRLGPLDGAPAVLGRHAGGALHVTFAPDGARLASTGADGDLVIWRLADRSAEETRHVCDGELVHAAFAPDGRSLAAGCRDGLVALVGEGGATRVVTRFADSVRHVAWSRDGARLAASDRGGALRVWDTGGVDTRSLSLSGVVRHFAFAPDGRTIAAAGDDGTVRLWDLDAGVVRVLRGHRQRVRHLAFSPDGRLLASASGDRTVRLWAMAPAAPSRLAGVGEPIRVTRLAAAGSILATAGEGAVKTWDLGSGRQRELAGVGAQVDDLEWSGARLIVASRSASLQVLDGFSGQRLASLATGGGRTRRLAASGDGKLVAASGSGPVVLLWDLETGARSELTGHEGKVDDLRFVPGTRTLATAGSDGTVRVWPPGRVLARAAGPVEALAVAADGRRLAFGAADGVVRVIELAGRGGEETFPAHVGAVRALAFSPDGETLLSGGDDGAVRRYRLASGQVDLLARHAGAVAALAWSPDGDGLASGGEDGVVRVYAAGAPRGALRVEAPLTWLGFSPDGRLLAAAEQGAIHLWPARVPAGEREARARLDALTTATLDGGDGLVAPWRTER